MQDRASAAASRMKSPARSAPTGAAIVMNAAGPAAIVSRATAAPAGGRCDSPPRRRFAGIRPGPETSADSADAAAEISTGGGSGRATISIFAGVFDGPTGRRAAPAPGIFSPDGGAITTICRTERVSFPNPTDAGRIGAYIGPTTGPAAKRRRNRRCRVKTLAYAILALTIITASCAAFVAEREADAPVMAVPE